MVAARSWTLADCPVAARRRRGCAPCLKEASGRVTSPRAVLALPRARGCASFRRKSTKNPFKGLYSIKERSGGVFSAKKWDFRPAGGGCQDLGGPVHGATDRGPGGGPGEGSQVGRSIARRRSRDFAHQTDRPWVPDRLPPTVPDVATMGSDLRPVRGLARDRCGAAAWCETFERSDRLPGASVARRDYVIPIPDTIGRKFFIKPSTARGASRRGEVRTLRRHGGASG